ncbi:MAG: GerMN domain-containing protein [Acidobacteriota bacterium]
MTPRGAAALLAVLLVVGCGGGESELGPDAEALPVPEESTEEEAEGLLSQINERTVLLFFPAEEGDLLVPEERVIFLTATVTSQVKQAVSEVLLGPNEEDAGAVAAFPARTRLLAIFILPDGTAVVDLGSEATAIPHGSAAELTAVYAIVNTVAYNFPGLSRVRFLVEGEEVETLAGHVDLTRPLAADLKRVDWGSMGAPTQPLGAAPPYDRWVQEEPTPLPEKGTEEDSGDMVGPV